MYYEYRYHRESVLSIGKIEITNVLKEIKHNKRTKRNKSLVN